jgi:peptidoglycan hydrolase CwlO-like protein
MSVEASRQIEELKRRIHVLEKQNAVLNTKARTLQDHSTSTSIDLGGSPLFPKKIL